LAIKIESIIEDDPFEASVVCGLRRWPAIKADLIADLEGLSGSIMVFGCGIVGCFYTGQVTTLSIPASATTESNEFCID
jgi:hypothetical protein